MPPPSGPSFRVSCQHLSGLESGDTRGNDGVFAQMIGRVDPMVSVDNPGSHPGFLAPKDDQAQRERRPGRDSGEFLGNVLVIGRQQRQPGCPQKVLGLE
ncbi:hypothetical protein GCM10023063_24090 [Arthrobacter methylotrophus]